MITITAIKEALDGWGWEVVVRDNSGAKRLHFDVGMLDLDDWANERYGEGEWHFINKTKLLP